MAFEESQLQIVNNDQKIFAIDLRSLAALRICLAAIVLGYVFGQFANLDTFFSEDGILPNELSAEYLNEDAYWSLYWLSNTTRTAQTMMVLTVLAAGSMLFGFQTRASTLLCLVLVWSLQIRNPLVLTAGDILLRMLLFWSLFLPLGRIWSVDSANEDRRPRSWNVISIASAAIMLQVAYMYFFSGIAKWNEYWLSGSAIEYSMNLEMYVKPLGSILVEYPTLMKILTFVTLLSEVICPILMFIPRITTFNRGVAMGVFWLLHLGVWLTMSIGLFSITAICAWLVFIPSEQWNAMLGQPVGFKNESSSRSRPLALFFHILTAVFLAYITLQNLANAGCWPINKIPNLEKFGATTMTIQKFHMFDRPPMASPWFEYVGNLDGGEKVDLFYFPHREFGQKPDSVFDYMQSQSWRRVHSNLVTELGATPQDSDGKSEIQQKIRQQLLDHIVETWDRKHPDQQVLSASLICHMDPIRIDADVSEEKEAEREFVWATYNRGSE